MKEPSVETLEKYFIYNPETGELFNKISRHYNAIEGTQCGSIHHARGGYRIVYLKGRVYKVHRICYKMYHGTIDDDKVIDHINGDTSDNRIKNLRLVNQYENAINRKVNKNNTSGITGIRFDPQRKKWECRIKHNFKDIFLGRFIEVDDAIKARKNAEEIYGYTVRTQQIGAHN